MPLPRAPGRIRAARHPGALPDFAMLMATLDREAVTPLRFAPVGCATTSDDEARMLALFAVARAHPVARLKRAAAGLVVEEAAARLVQAADSVATALATAAAADRTGPCGS